MRTWNLGVFAAGAVSGVMLLTACGAGPQATASKPGKTEKSVAPSAKPSKDSESDVRKLDADAGPPQHLEQAAGGYEQSFSPAYDYDGNGCYATPAIGADGTLASGLGLGGAVNGHCRDLSDLQNSQTYARSKADNGWVAVMYASYFEKDQSSEGVGEIAGGTNGHRNDWEHVVTWINQSTNQVEYVSVSQHGKYKTYPRSEVQFEGTHPKVVYHKDGGFTHDFRIANTNDEPPENHLGTWVFPPIVDWNGWPSAELRDKLMNASFGEANLDIRDSSFPSKLADAKPAEVPFNPAA
ncbi:NPP1 family protein [Streptomyces sp. NPDC059785]|uniref:NPP1 family protein n=1 Tax=Streptomyces sp. NPDC059785 TaxID=3346945 RepID=UPI003657A18B